MLSQLESKENEEVLRVKQKFIEFHNRIPEMISADALKSLLEIGSLQLQIDCDDITKKFQYGLQEELLKEFEKMWNTNNLDVHLMILSQMKQNNANKNEKAWRPTGKKPEEQVLSLTANLLRRKLSYLEELREQQRQQIETLLPGIEEKRKHLKDVLQLRTNTLEELNRKHEHMDNVFKDVRDSKGVLYDKLMEF